MRGSNGDCAKGEIVSYVDIFVNFGTQWDVMFPDMLVVIHCTKNIHILVQSFRFWLLKLFPE